ncbi:HAMP domain-containing sensor histidine kinase [Flavobacterium sp.]|uniref:sensor histidine kinase n=1 Tax=Flavobacterium sp. TaxID=239 RepID=UPI002C85D0FC|nr:HAMP domain-containing sensor histidine kinase [Flavobacterium sp.]HQA73524.1 HAMP domain-containing sensor histidine kinase [Flavobacterium sp.]
MKIKHQLAVFNVLIRLILIFVLWFFLPKIIEKVVYNHIDKSLFEKEKTFINRLNKQEINDFIRRNDASETYASFSTLHSEFIQLYQSNKKLDNQQNYIINEARIIESEESNYRVLYYHFNYANANYILEIGNNLSELEDIIRALRFSVLMLLLIVVSVTFFADILLVEYLFKPFNKIIQTKIKFANEPDNFNFEKIKSHSSDFDILDTGLNQMMIRINELFQKERQFISNVSHELLTPISVLKNRFENLLQNDTINEEVEDKIVSSLRNLDMMKKIIHNLLLISRIENNQYQLEDYVSIKQLINEIIKDFEDRIEEKNIEIFTNYNEDIVIKGNKTLLHILLFNLILNALKYNFVNGKIEIVSYEENNQFYLSISNTGHGIAKDQLDTIFNRFSRNSNDQEGQGIGLAMAKSIAKVHAIEIQVASSIDDKTTFTLLFPKQ